MKRTTIFLPKDQIKELERVSKKNGIKVAQLIRIYIAAGLGGVKP
jgi:hypothetical protein